MKKFPLIFAGIIATASVGLMAQDSNTGNNDRRATDDSRLQTPPDSNDRRFNPNRDTNTPTPNRNRTTDTDRRPDVDSDRNVESEQEREDREHEMRRGINTPGAGKPGTTIPRSDPATETGVGTGTADTNTGGTWPKTDAEETRGINRNTDD